MTTRNWYQQTERELKGRRVRTLVEMSNGFAIIPAGADGVITRKFSGLSVDFDACKCCGMRVRIRKASPGGFALLPEDVSR